MPDPSRTRDHWDALAADYDAAKARNRAYYDALKALVGAAVPLSRRGRLLELGCGTGQILASLDPAAGLGVDASARMIEQAQRRHAGRPELRFAVGDAAAAAEHGTFDAIVGADLLEHVHDWRAVVDAAATACAPGGRIVLTTPSPAWALPLWLLERARLKMPEGPHCFVHRRRIAAALRERGCAVLACGTHLILPLRLGGLGPRLSARAARLPLTRTLGVIQLVVAERPGPGPDARQAGGAVR